jgi:hypothetical protein
MSRMFAAGASLLIALASGSPAWAWRANGKTSPS